MEIAHYQEHRSSETKNCQAWRSMDDDTILTFS